MAAFLKQLDEASTKDTLELYLRYMAKLSTVPMFTEQVKTKSQ